MDAKDKITQTVKEIKESCDNYLLYADDDHTYEMKMIDNIIDGARDLVIERLAPLYKTREGQG